MSSLVQAAQAALRALTPEQRAEVLRQQLLAEDGNAHGAHAYGTNNVGHIVTAPTDLGVGTGIGLQAATGGTLWYSHDMSQFPPSGIANCATFSWAYMPLIFEAAGLPPPPTWTFPRHQLPLGWDRWVQAYRADFERLDIGAAWVNHYLDGPGHLPENLQNLLIDSLLAPGLEGEALNHWAYGQQQRAYHQQQFAYHQRQLQQHANEHRNSQRLSEVSSGNVDDCVRWLVDELEHPQHGWPGWHNLRETINDPADLVRGFVMAYFHNRFDQCAFERSYVVLIFGDVQRGKTGVESLFVVLACRMCQASRVSDRPCTLLGTGMVPWARALHTNVGRLAGDFLHDAGRLEQQARDELLQDGQPGGLVVTASSSSDNELMRVMRLGGVVVFARTAKQISRVQRVAEQLVQEQLRSNEVVTSFNLVLDEADMMLGSGEDNFQYEQALHALENALRPPLYVRVSATNETSVFDMMRRYIDQEQPVFEMLQIVPFRSPNPLTYMANFRPPVNVHGHSVYLNSDPSTTPRRTDEYVCPAVVDTYQEALTWPNGHACVLDCLARGVRYTTNHNMQDHVEAIVSGIEARTNQPVPNMASVVVHGGHVAHEGMIGVRLDGPDADALAEVLRVQVELASGTPTPSLVNSHGYIENASLRPLLEQIDEQAVECAAVFGRTHQRLCDPSQRLSTTQLPLTLFVLRHFFPGIPVAVVGGGMIRRCLSVIAPNYLRRHADEPEVLLCVTHTILTATEKTNVADVVQKFQRGATTATEFFRRHGFTEIQVLAPKQLWRLVNAAVAFNRNTDWLQVENWHAFKRMIAANIDPLQALLQCFRMPLEVTPLFTAANPMHKDATRLTAIPRELAAAEHQRNGLPIPMDLGMRRDPDCIAPPRRASPVLNSERRSRQNVAGRQCDRCGAEVGSTQTGRLDAVGVQTAPLMLSCGHSLCGECSSEALRLARSRGLNGRGQYMFRPRSQVECPISGCNGRGEPTARRDTAPGAEHRR